jgi:hypothetical protein
VTTETLLGVAIPETGAELPPEGGEPAPSALALLLPPPPPHPANTPNTSANPSFFTVDSNIICATFVLRYRSGF